MENTTKTQRAAIEATVNHADDMTHMSVPLGTLTLDFANGQAITVDAGQLSPDIIGQAIMHGLKQKLVDAAAISRNPDTGRAASVDDKYNAVQEVFMRLLAGEWNKRREGGGNAGGLLFQALVRKYDGKKSAESIKEWLGTKSDKEKAALRKNPEIAKIIDEIRAEQGDASASADLLAELDGEE